MVLYENNNFNNMKVPLSTNSLNLGTKYLGRNTLYYPEVESTNEIAISVAQNGGPEGTVIIADKQTKGQGRLQREWYSPKGKGLWFSIILKPNIDPIKVSQLTLVAAVATADAVSKVIGLSPGIKWPNDLLINGRKFCGILSEGQIGNEGIDYVILGIGLNANLDFYDFGLEIRSKATSLKIETGKHIERTQLFREILCQLEKCYETWLREGFEPIRLAWKEKNITLGQLVQVNSFQEVFQGKAIDIDNGGALIVKDKNNKIYSFNSGEVSLSTEY